jgi:hypothetical protein
MDGCRLRPANDIQRDRLVRVAAEAFHLKIQVTGVERVAEGRGGLGRSLIPEHALVPGLTGQPIGFFAPRLPAPLMPGSSCHRFARVTWCPSREDARGRVVSASRYGLRLITGLALGGGWRR